MALTDAKIKSAKSTDKPVKLFDNLGLYLLVSPTGLKTWKYKLRTGGKDTTLTLGDYPTIRLIEARRQRDLIRLKARAGAPVLAEEVQQPVLFRDAADAWLARQRTQWKPAHFERVKKSVERELNPEFGHLALADITPNQVAEFLLRVQARGVNDHAHDLRQRIRNIFRLAQSRGDVDRNPAEAMTAVMTPIPKATHRAALVQRAEVLQMVQKVEATSGHRIIKAAFRLTLLTALRQSEIRFGRWDEIQDLDGPAPLWVIPGHRMKGKEVEKQPPHLVPLSRQAVELLRELKPITHETGMLVPAFQRGRGPISENALNLLLERAGYKGRQTAHGLRSCFSSIMKKRNRADSHVIELMLAHLPPGEVARAYDREEYLDERRALFQVWADIVMEKAPSAAELLGRPRRMTVEID